MRPECLRVGGLVPFSTVDYPGQISAVLFCQGCPWRCRYCHNAHLQRFAGGNFSWGEIEQFLRVRIGLLDAVVFSGGEPTAQASLGEAMRFARSQGYKIGLHTAGILPDRLAEVLPLVDWVGFDVKAPFDSRYDAITGVSGSWRATQSSLEHLLRSGVDYEIRTTVHPALLDGPALEDIESLLQRAGAKPSRWQTFRAEGCGDAELVAEAHPA